MLYRLLLLYLPSILAQFPQLIAPTGRSNAPPLILIREAPRLLAPGGNSPVNTGDGVEAGGFARHPTVTFLKNPRIYVSGTIPKGVA